MQPEILERLMDAYDYQLKFVIARPEDVEEARPWWSGLRPTRRKSSSCPRARTPETLRERALWLAELCKREGWRFSPRLHVDL